MLNTIQIGDNMYLLHKQNGSHTVVVRRETLKSAVESMEAFADDFRLQMTMNPETMYPEANGGNVKAWIELEPYKQVTI
jgi:hypothetical protein